MKGVGNELKEEVVEEEVKPLLFCVWEGMR